MSTRLARPVHTGKMLEAPIGAADGLPWPRNTMPRTTSRDPGMSVPMISPQEASPESALVPCEDTQTPVQYRTTITMAV